MDNLTPDGKIKTIRCVKATHADFAKLVNMGKKVLQEIDDMEKLSHITLEGIEVKLQEGNYEMLPFQDGTLHPIVEVYSFLLKKQAEIDAYRNAYHVLMEEGVDELLASISIGAESYNYDFYELCLEF